MKSILTMAWTADDPSAFDLAAKIARKFDARLVGLHPSLHVIIDHPFDRDEHLHGLIPPCCVAKNLARTG